VRRREGKKQHMKYPDAAIHSVLNDLFEGDSISRLSRKHGISEKTIRRWKREWLVKVGIDYIKRNRSSLSKKMDSDKAYPPDMEVVIIEIRLH
jgi:transposase-like protein